MAYIDTPPESELYAADEAVHGFVPNFTRVFAHRPDVYRAWQGLNGAVKAGMDLRRYELATLAAARALGSDYCRLAHLRVLGQWFDAEELAALAAGDRGGLDEVDRAVMAFAERIATDATAVTQADVDGLKALGLTDADVADVALAASVRAFFSKTLDALGAKPDDVYRDVLAPAVYGAVVR
jgi:alkylhydroperoxidase family enzyme